MSAALLRLCPRLWRNNAISEHTTTLPFPQDQSRLSQATLPDALAQVRKKYHKSLAQLLRVHTYQKRQTPYQSTRTLCMVSTQEIHLQNTSPQTVLTLSKFSLPLLQLTTPMSGRRISTTSYFESGISQLSRYAVDIFCQVYDAMWPVRLASRVRPRRTTVHTHTEWGTSTCILDISYLRGC